MPDARRSQITQLTAAELDRYTSQLARCLKALGTLAPIRADVQRELAEVWAEQDTRASANRPGDSRSYDVSGMPAAGLERTRRELAVSLALARPDSPARVPIQAQMAAIDAELAARAALPEGLPGSRPPDPGMRGSASAADRPAGRINGHSGHADTRSETSLTECLRPWPGLRWILAVCGVLVTISIRCPERRGEQSMSARNITTRTDQASSCYFRTTADDGTRKALVQIDERCNLHCAHCFVSATRAGESMPYDGITGLLIPRLKACRVERVTLTGGEPTIHPRFTGIIRALRGAGMQVGFCTNATTLTDAQISELAGIGGVHANVSLDGFRAESHGRFRGDRDSFAVTVATVRKLAAAGLLQGLLCTPNSLAEDEEYRELCQFAAGNGASYVLMNPLSSMGRGVKSRGRLADSEEHMRRIRALTAPFDSPDLEIVHIRFPSIGGQPLAGCEAGTIIYVFTAGEMTVCPYLVFAARTPQSRHDPGEFIVGNIFTDPDIAARLDAYRFAERYEMGANPTCRSCGIAGQCGKGCPAAVIAAGERIGAVDTEVCPVTSGERLLLPLMTA